MTDPVASRSGFLCAYMSNHPDTLVAYVRHFGKIKVPVVSATMTSIDTKGMTLSYVEKETSAKKQVTVSFDPRLSAYEEVKPWLLEMKLDAEEALGMTRRAQIPFVLPAQVILPGLLLALLTYVTYSPGSSSPLFDRGVRIHTAIGGLPTIRIIWGVAATLHILEAGWMLRSCMRHSLGLAVSAKYVTTTFIFGFPAIQKFRQLVQNARIESISKVN